MPCKYLGLKWVIDSKDGFCDYRTTTVEITGHRINTLGVIPHCSRLDVTAANARTLRKIATEIELMLQEKVKER